MTNFNLQQYLDQNTGIIDAELDRRLPAETVRPEALHKAMRYCVFAGGKRIRPLLCLAAAELVCGRPDVALLPAIAIEILHTYTLIHDDLPCMDNDTLRRGKPTAHVMFGEANAVLAGDALLTLGLELLAETSPPAPYLPNQLVLELARAMGNRGVIAGQVEDKAAEGMPPDANLVEYIHLHKTALLLRASVRAGGIAAGATENELNALSQYGEKLGIAYQIVDDILNATSCSEVLGKAAGSDKEQHKMTYVTIHGLEDARAMAEKLNREAVLAIGSVWKKAEPLISLANHLIKRKH